MKNVYNKKHIGTQSSSWMVLIKCVYVTYLFTRRIIMVWHCLWYTTLRQYCLLASSCRLKSAKKREEKSSAKRRWRQPFSLALLYLYRVSANANSLHICEQTKGRIAGREREEKKISAIGRKEEKESEKWGGDPKPKMTTIAFYYVRFYTLL